VVLTLSNWLARGPEAKARAAVVTESWFFFKLLAATFEEINLNISINFLNYIFV
jgi:hypothetical protein